MQVFLCHSSEDKTGVRDLYQRLHQDGINAWLDEEDLLPGQKWRLEITKAVRGSDVVIVCLSRQSQSQSGFVNKEILLALDVAEEQPEDSIFIIPVKLEPCDTPERLSHIHHVNLFEERGYKQLLRAIQVRADELATRAVDEYSLPPLQDERWSDRAMERPSDETTEQTSNGATERTNDHMPNTLLLPSNNVHQVVYLPNLEQQGLYRRIGIGSVIDAFPVPQTTTQVLIISSGGATLYDMQQQHVLWEIDCPAQCGAVNFTHQLLALGNRQVIHVWDINQKVFLKTLHGHTSRVMGVAFSPNGYYLASGSNDQTAQLWRISHDQPVCTLHDHTDIVKCVAFSHNSTLLATGTANGTVRIWHVAQQERLLLLPGRASINSIAFSPDDDMLAVGAANGMIRLWRTADGERIDILRGHKKSVRGIAFSPDGSLLASASVDQTIRLWQTVDGSCIQILKGHHNSVQHVTFADDTPQLVSVSDDQSVRLWAPNSKEDNEPYGYAPLSTYPSGVLNVTSVAWAPNGDTFAIATGDHTIQLWHPAANSPSHLLHGHTATIKCLAFHPDGTMLASGSDDETICLWNVADGSLLNTLRHSDWVRSIAFSPDGSTIASGSQDVWLWDVATGRLLHTFKRHADHVASVAFTADGTTLASGSWNGTVRLWNVADGKRVRSLRERDSGVLLSIMFAPGSDTLLIVSNDKTIRLWRRENGVLTRSLKGYRGTILNVAFSPDCKSIAAACGDGAVRLWNVAHGTFIGSLHGHVGGVQSVAFSPDGMLVASGSEDGSVRLWRRD